jgi:hypothetical protein
MRRPFAAAVVVAAFIGAPLAAQAADAHHHKLNHVTFHRSIRGGYGIDGARIMQSPPADHWCIATNVAGAGACGGPGQDRLFSNG